MKPASRVVFNVDKRKATDIYYGEEHYVIEGNCTECGECCKKFRLHCEFLKTKSRCKIHENNPWFCALYPYDLDCFETLPETCNLSLRRVH